MTYFHILNNTGSPLVLWYASRRVEVPPGRWCCSGTPPHCQPKERP